MAEWAVNESQVGVQPVVAVSVSAPILPLGLAKGVIVEKRLLPCRHLEVSPPCARRF